MAKRWTEREQRSKNLPTADGFNREYDQLKGWANGGIDRTSIPVGAVAHDMVKHNAFCRVFVEDVEFAAPSRNGTTVYRQFSGLTYKSYAGGFYPAAKISLSGLFEGMMHLEFKCWTSITKYDDVYNPRFVEFRILYNNSVVCEGAPCYHPAFNYFLACDFPIVGGTADVGIEYRVTPPMDIDNVYTEQDDPVMYYGGGQLLAIGRWR